jgi:hypothetical protein
MMTTTNNVWHNSVLFFISPHSIPSQIRNKEESSVSTHKLLNVDIITSAYGNCCNWTRWFIIIKVTHINIIIIQRDSKCLDKVVINNTDESSS